jgi:hypothetical protein
MAVLLLLALATSLFAQLPDSACARCHAKIAASYRRTAMAQTSGSVFRIGRPPQAFAPLSIDQNWHAKAKDIERDIVYYLGSGRVGRSYLNEVDGILFQFPFSSYSATNRFAASPGYDHSQRLDFSRAVEPACLQCHTAAKPHDSPTPAMFNGVSCERCHGSGDQHIKNPIRGNIVNPSRLASEERDSVCAQCHLTAAARVATLRGEQQDYVPGQRLQDFVAIFTQAGGNTKLSVIGHTERLALSRCQQASEGKLWCATCHDPHSEPTPAQRIAYFRSKCESCHTTKNTCSLALDQRQAQSNDCIACHMPKSPTQGIDHSASTDHAILRTSTSQRQSADGLRPWWPTQADLTRETALAHAVLKSPEAIPSLRDALAKFPSDKRLNLQLAQLLPPSEALPFYERALPLPAASVNVGIAQAEAKRYQDALTNWRAALKLDPTNAAARLNLVHAWIRLGEPGRALTELETLLRFDPDRPELHRLAAQLRSRLRTP